MFAAKDLSLLFRAEITRVSTILAIIITILAQTHLIVRLAKHTKTVARALSLKLAAGTADEHSSSWIALSRFT